MYRLDTKLHGTTASNTWGDYPQIGFDEQAVYIMTRCFSFGGGFNYTRLELSPKLSYMQVMQVRLLTKIFGI